MLDNTIPEHSGRAFCFDSQQDALKALNNGSVKAGSVVVVRYSGPRGAPGMPDIYAVLATIVGQGAGGEGGGGDRWPVFGVCEGASAGARFRRRPAVGGPLALVKDGDIIEISLPKRSLHLKVSDRELAKRRKSWRAPKAKREKGILGLYATILQNRPTWGPAYVTWFLRGG